MLHHVSDFLMSLLGGLTCTNPSIKFLFMKLKMMQLLALKNSFIRMKLGLRDEKVPLRERVSSEKALPENNIHLTEISVDTLSPQKLLDVRS